MILVSAEGKGLVKIKSWQDIVERPGYLQEIDPKSAVLHKIIGEYSLDSKPKCGLKGCATPHVRGYLVVCKDGTETNIGNVCGKRIFNVSFDALKASFRRDINEKGWREAIGVFRNQMAPISKKIEFLSNGEFQGCWCFKELQFHAERAYPEDVLKRLNHRAKTGDAAIKKAEQLTARELELAGKRSKNKFRENTVATLNGLPALRDYKKLRKLLSVDLGSDLASFAQIDEHVISAIDLKRWYKWTCSVDSKIRQVEAIIEDAQRFLLISNIETIKAYKHLL